MAENKEVVFGVEVDGVEKGINSLKDLKNAIKAAKDEQLKAAEAYGEGSKEYIKASQNVSKLKDKVDDLNDSTKSLKGSGVERASEGFSQLGEGLRNLDFDKVKVGLIAMKSALAAVGIGLVVQLVSYLIENFDSLSQGSGLLAKTLRGVGDVVSFLVEKLTDFTDLLGLTNSELDKQGEAIKNNADKAKEALANQTAEYDRQIAIAKASGKSAVDLEIAKQQAIIETNKALVEQTIAYVRNGGILNEEQNKLLTEQLNAIKGAVNQQKVIEITANKESLDRQQKYYEEKKKIEQDDWNKTLEIRRSNLDAQEKDDARLAELDKQTKLDARNAEMAYMNEQEALNAEQNRTNVDTTYNYAKAKRDQELSEFKDNKQQQLALTKQALGATQQITDLYFAYRLNKVKGDEKAELEVRKKQFQVNKAFGIVNATIDGISAVQKALNNPYPLNIVLAAISGVAAAANIAKIASTKFDGGGASGGGGASTPSAPNVPDAPTISTQQNNLNNNTTQFDEQGNKVNQNPTVKVEASIGVDEVSEKQNKVKVYEATSRF